MFELKESDLPELERLAAEGFKWVARDDLGDRLYTFMKKPTRYARIWAMPGRFPGDGSRLVRSKNLESIRWLDKSPTNIAAAIAQIKAQKIDGDSNEKCPICEYKISGCQCRYGGSAHPDRNDKRRVVFDHLHLLSLTQLQHVISLEKYWQISYSDADLNAILKRLIANSPCEGGEGETND